MVDLRAAIGDVAATTGLVDVMVRMVTAALLAALVGLWLPVAAAQAQTAPPGFRTAQAAPTDNSAQRRRLRRVPIYPREEWRPPVYPQYNPGPNAVRECNATYVQEYRQSGTVITPRMHCYWRRG